MCPVKRPTGVKIKARGLNGEKIELKLNGLVARIFQHEFDHLQVRLSPGDLLVFLSHQMICCFEVAVFCRNFLFLEHRIGHFGCTDSVDLTR